MLNKLLDKLDKKIGMLAIPHLTAYLVFGQLFFFLLFIIHPELEEGLVLIPIRIMNGEVWRLVLFPFLPPQTHPIFLFFALYILWLMGSALENHWGIFRYNVYLFVGYLMTIAAAWINPYSYVTNVYLMSSIFLAFAYLYPDFELMLFFLLPIKVKWLAMITWILYGITFIMGDWLTRVLILASVTNYLLFFGREIIHKARTGHRRMQHRAKAIAEHDKPFHQCAVCGKTDKTNPKLEFRYCPHCTGTPCYCIDHIHNHEHK